MKGLFIGINYLGMSCELNGCINDAKNLSDLYKKIYGLKNYVILTDDNKYNMPTKKNILNGVLWLTKNNNKNEQLFFHYSGHGVDVRDDGYHLHDGILPCDYLENGYIDNNKIKSMLTDDSHNGRLFAVFDNCRSEKILDLPFVYDPSINKLKHNPIDPNIVMLSNSSKKSIDVTILSENKILHYGALSWALKEVLQKSPFISYQELMKNISNIYIKAQYDQLPRLSFNIYPDVTTSVVKI